MLGGGTRSWAFGASGPSGVGGTHAVAGTTRRGIGDVGVDAADLAPASANVTIVGEPPGVAVPIRNPRPRIRRLPALVPAPACAACASTEIGSVGELGAVHVGVAGIESDTDTGSGSAKCEVTGGGGSSWPFVVVEPEADTVGVTAEIAPASDTPADGSVGVGNAAAARGGSSSNALNPVGTDLEVGSGGVGSVGNVGELGAVYAMRSAPALTLGLALTSMLALPPLGPGTKWSEAMAYRVSSLRSLSPSMRCGVPSRRSLRVLVRLRSQRDHWGSIIVCVRVSKFKSKSEKDRGRDRERQRRRSRERRGRSEAVSHCPAKASASASECERKRERNGDARLGGSCGLLT
jgi:hypothetical protein